MSSSSHGKVKDLTKWNRIIRFKHMQDICRYAVGAYFFIHLQSWNKTFNFRGIAVKNTWGFGSGFLRYSWYECFPSYFATLQNIFSYTWEIGIKMICNFFFIGWDCLLSIVGQDDDFFFRLIISLTLPTFKILPFLTFHAPQKSSDFIWLYRDVSIFSCGP